VADRPRLIIDKNNIFFAAFSKADDVATDSWLELISVLNLQMLEMVSGVGVAVGNKVHPYPVTAWLSAWLELAVMVSYSPWRFPRLSVTSFFETGVCELYFHKF